MVKVKKIIKTKKDIQTFLITCGFERFNSIYSGVCEYLKDIQGDDIYVYQINGEGITDIESPDEMVIFCENGKNPSITPMYRYSKEYQNLKAMVEAESNRGIDFSGGLKKWSLK